MLGDGGRGAEGCCCHFLDSSPLSFPPLLGSASYLLPPTSFLPVSCLLSSPPASSPRLLPSPHRLLSSPQTAVASEANGGANLSPDPESESQQSQVQTGPRDFHYSAPCSQHEETPAPAEPTDDACLRGRGLV